MDSPYSSSHWPSGIRPSWPQDRKASKASTSGESWPGTDRKEVTINRCMFKPCWTLTSRIFREHNGDLMLKFLGLKWIYKRMFIWILSINVYQAD